MSDVETCMRVRRAGPHFFRIARALACSLLVHGIAFAALWEGPRVEPRLVSVPVELSVAWNEPVPEPIERSFPAADVPEWIPPLLEAEPVQTPFVAPPDVALAAPEWVAAAEPSEMSDQAAPYWVEVRRELARALRWPPGCRAGTNVEVRFHAVASGLLPLSPMAGGDVIQTAVRTAVENVAHHAPRPPDELLGSAIRLTVRFEPK